LPRPRPRPGSVPFRCPFWPGMRLAGRWDKRGAPMPTLTERLKSLFPEASGVSRKDWLARGRVTVNGAVVRDGRSTVADRDRVRLGDETVPRITLAHPL